MDSADSFSSETWHEKTDDPVIARVASEVLLLVSGDSKNAKYLQAVWLLEHINDTVSVKCPSEEDELTVVALTASDGLPIAHDESLKIIAHTAVTSIARSYRIVIILDISPSTLIVDGCASCVPHFRILECFHHCISKLTEPFLIFGGAEFYPKIYVTVCFYTPFIAVDEDPVVIQGYLLNSGTVDRLFHYVEKRLASFSNNLCAKVQPHMRRWNQERRKVQQEAEDLLPENFFRQQSQADGFLGSNHGLVGKTPRTDTCDEGFIRSEWAIMFMLRSGLLGLQMMSERAQSNILLISDGVCYVNDVQALQQVMTQLRNHAVSCSFVQMQDECNTNAVFGHFASPEFFHFLALATYGKYMTCSNFGSEVNMRKIQEKSLTSYASKSLLYKSLKLGASVDEHVLSLIRKVNPEFVEPYLSGIVRRLYFSMEYDVSLDDILRLRLREGFMIRHIKFSEKSRDRTEIFIVIELSLPWKEQITIAYKVTSPWPNYTERAKLRVCVICEAPHGIIKDLISDRHHVSLAKQSLSDAYRRTIYGLLEADRMMIHVHSFNSLPDLYNLPSEMLREKALFRYVLSGGKPTLTLSTRELENIRLQTESAAHFVDFWRTISEFDETLWQKWFHIHVFRIVLMHDHPLPSGLFLPEQQAVKVTAQYALSAFHAVLAQMTTFSLVHGQAYVKFVEGSERIDVPKSFYVIKLRMDSPFIVLKLAFLDGLHAAFRDKVIAECRSNLISLTIEKRLFFIEMHEFADSKDVSTISETVHTPALAIIERPLEFTLLRYKTIPLVLDRILRLESIDEPNPDLILHNSLTKYFRCRRSLWYLKKMFSLSSPVGCLSADFILHTILQRRLNDGFHIAYSCNGIVNLVKTYDKEDDIFCGPAVCQYVLFPPSAIRQLRITKQEMEEMPSLSTSVSMRAGEVPGILPGESFTLKTEVELQLITEIWVEPLAAVDEHATRRAQNIQEEIQKCDEAIITTLSTLDEVMSLCTHHYSKPQITLPDISDHLLSQRLSANVQIIHNCFFLGSLLKNATERELLLLPTLSYHEDDPVSTIRLEYLLSSLHRELAHANNVTIEVPHPNFWFEITKGIDPRILKTPKSLAEDSEKNCQTSIEVLFHPTRIYVTRLSPWRVTITALLVHSRHILAATSHVIPTIPLLIFHCDEPWIAHNLAQTRTPTCMTYVSDHRTKSPTSTLAHLSRQIRKTDRRFSKSEGNLLELHWLSSSRICTNENRVHTSFDLHSYCDAIEDQLFSRALIAAVYRSLLEGVHIPQEDLTEVLEERCEHSDIEVNGIDECIRFLCSHVSNIRKQSIDTSTEDEDDSRGSDFFKDDAVYRIDATNQKSCMEEQEEFRNAFNDLLFQNFKRIPNYPSYFYFVRNGGTHLSGQNLTIRPRDVNGDLSAETSGDDLEICFAGSQHEGPVATQGSVSGENNSVRSNKSSVSFETASISGSSVYDAWHPLYSSIVPLFLNFSCTIHFSNREMHTVPVDHLPSCVLELVQQCPDIAENTALALNNISFDIFVLSWPAIRVANEHSDAANVSVRSQNGSPQISQKINTYFDFDNFPPHNDVIAQLPHLEGDTVKKLQSGITRLLYMETVFVLSRFEETTLDTLNRVAEFTASEALANSDPDRIKLKSLQVVMVMDHMKAIRRLKERLKNLRILYCELKQHPEASNLFYCCCVQDVELYETTMALRRGQLSVTVPLCSSSVPEQRETAEPLGVAKKASSAGTLNVNVPCAAYGDTSRRRQSFALGSYSIIPDGFSEQANATNHTEKFVQKLKDFWLIVNVEIQQIRISFCERYTHHHSKLFDQLYEAVQKECHVINQELLLEKMHATNECDSLLIESETVQYAFAHDDVVEMIPDTKLTRSLISKRQPMQRRKAVSFSFVDADDENLEPIPSISARTLYRPGHFACPVVFYHWFYIHPRLHSEQFRGKGYSLVMGYDALRQGIEKFAVRNRRNLYVFCEENKRNIYYMQLFATVESFNEKCKESRALEVTEDLDQKFATHLLLTVHGVRQPGDEVHSIVETMQKRLDLRVLEELTSTLYKNPLTRLTSTDVEFIQRNPAKPYAVYYCTLPSFISRYLGSVYFYLFQQMLTFATEARFRDSSGSKERSPYERVHFHSQQQMETVCENYVPRFFIINRPPTKGSSNLGIACVETRIVDATGACVGNLQYARVSPTTHLMLYPGGRKNRRSAVERFHELTRCISTSLPLPDSLTRDKSGDVMYLVQYNIWQVGEIGLSVLQPRFRLALQQALCDLATEFGLLGVSIMEASLSPSPTGHTVRHRTSHNPNETTAERKRSSSEAGSAVTQVSTQAVGNSRKSMRMQLPTQEQLLSRGPRKPHSPIKAFAKFSFDTTRKQTSLVSRSSDDTSVSRSDDGEQFDIFLNTQFVTVAADWFDHVVSEVKSTEHQFSVRKHTFHIDSDHSIITIFTAIRDILCGLLCNETVALCQLETKGESKRYSMNSCPAMSVVSFLSDDGRVVDAENEFLSLILLAGNLKYMEETLKYGTDPTMNIIPATIEEVIHNAKDSSLRFAPQIAPFVPRQHLLYLVARGETTTLYLYNYSLEAAERVHKKVSDVISWQNARSRLLREIGLHKMGITHLPARLAKNHELIWLQVQLFHENEYPAFGDPIFEDKLMSCSVRPSQADAIMRLYRYTNVEFLPCNLSENLLVDQCTQMAMLERDMRFTLSDVEQFRQIHRSMLKGARIVREVDFLKIVNRCRLVHFVRSPLLLFPKWRRAVALVRKAASRNSRPKTSDIAERRTSITRPFRMDSSVFPAQVRSSRSSTFSSSSMRSSEGSIIRRLSDEDEPCCMKIQYMLVESYVDYLKKLGLTLIDVVTEGATTRKGGGRYSLYYDTKITENSPNIWLYKACEAGILFIHLTIVEPHFSVRYMVWDASQVDRYVNMHSEVPWNYKQQRELEAIKDNFLSKSHVHSFTYDFHLRMVATYLVGGQQVLFNPGYNTTDFLVDFLHYYNCRPPYARNCICEEKLILPNVPISTKIVWEHLLNDKRNIWRVVRLKSSDITMPRQYMLVSEEEKKCLGLAYKEVRVIKCESQCISDLNTLRIRIHVMLVSQEKTDPFLECLNCEESDNLPNSDEFREVETADRSDKSTEKSLSQDTDILDWEDERLQSPSVSSEADLSRKLSNETCNSTRKLSIQNITQFQHRRPRPSSNIEKGTVVPREQAFYVYYLCPRQKKLQDELEECVMHYKRKLLTIVEDAIWHSKRDLLWNSMLNGPPKGTEPPTSHSSSKLLHDGGADSSSLLKNVSSATAATTDIDSLLGYVRSKSLYDQEPLLETLVEGVTATALFRTLILHFGVPKCRLFISPLKEHLVIMTAELQNSVFLLTAFPEGKLEMRLLLKDDDKSLPEVDELSSAVREQFDEIVRCAASLVWMNLIQSPITNK